MYNRSKSYLIAEADMKITKYVRSRQARSADTYGNLHEDTLLHVMDVRMNATGCFGIFTDNIAV